MGKRSSRARGQQVDVRHEVAREIVLDPPKGDRFRKLRKTAMKRGVPPKPSKEERAPLGEEELGKLFLARGFGKDGTAQWVPNGQFKDVACFNWALSGGSYDGSMIEPSHAFNYFGEQTFVGGGDWDSERQEAVYVDPPTSEQYVQRVGHKESREWLAQNREALENMRQQLLRKEIDVHQVVRALAEAMVRSNGMEPCGKGESPYAITLEYEASKGDNGKFHDVVNWTHWGVQVTVEGESMTLETYPDTFGVWSEKQSFEDAWAHDGDEDDKSRYVLTIPVLALTPRHNQALRQLLQDRYTD